MPRFTLPGATCAHVLSLPPERGTLACWPLQGPGAVGTGVNWPDLRKPLFTDPDVGFLFISCRNPGTGISDEQFKAAAKQLNIELAQIRAVAEVESPRGPFDEDGRPTILFERHYFSRLTNGKFDRKHPDISNPNGGGYGLYSAQYGKLERAYKLAPSAALKSASWGRFQIMGANHGLAGFDTVRAFVDAMARAEVNHLNAFVAFIAADRRLSAALLKKDWATFASIYNGSGYKKNDYDGKLKRAYDKHKAAEPKAPAPPGAPAAVRTAPVRR